jgi:hypothetical protein
MNERRQKRIDAVGADHRRVSTGGVHTRYSLLFDHRNAPAMAHGEVVGRCRPRQTRTHDDYVRVHHRLPTPHYCGMFRPVLLRNHEREVIRITIITCAVPVFVPQGRNENSPALQYWKAS